jgi:hypothetical protein
MSRYSICNPEQFTALAELYSMSVQGHDGPNVFCVECDIELADLDREGSDTTCWYCLHPTCEDGDPCQDCYEIAIDRAHDSMDTER